MLFLKPFQFLYFLDLHGIELNGTLLSHYHMFDRRQSYQLP